MALTLLAQAARVLEGETDEEPQQIRSCFNWLRGVDAPNEYRDREDENEYSAWRAAFKPEESPIPDGFYLALMDISIPEDPYWRVRRLQEMTTEERETAAKDVEPYPRKRDADNRDDNVAGPSTERGEGSGGGAGAVDGSGQADVPGEVKEREGSSDDTDRVDAPREAEGHGDSGNNPEVDAEELELDTNVAPAPESDGHRLAADSKHGAKPDEAISEDTVEPNLAAVGLPHTKPSEDALPEAAELSDTKSPNDALPEAETVADNPADKGISDDRSPESVLLDPGNNSDVIKVQDSEQGPGSSGDGGEQAGTDVGHEEVILDDGLQRSEEEHVMTFR
ncbi:hypothetical protein BDW22DRAFT_1100697 [Trametopsis cervina]|nr:hypothetical protein BDW22DRAFT_1100697 [Trametopsis cervina]